MPTKNKKTSKSKSSNLRNAQSQLTNSQNQLKSVTLFPIIGGILGLIINIFAIMWIFKLENIDCKCSNNWMRLYIKYYLLLIIPIICITLLINVYLYFNNLVYSDITNSLFSLYRLFAGFVTIIGLINIVISIIFINRLKEINCVCSEDIKREVYYIYNIVLASLICITILLFLMAVPLMLSNLNK
jgi:small-conductance mechanosensitive channel